MTARNQAYLSHKRQEEDRSIEKIEIDSSSDLTSFNADEINKLKSFLKTIQDGACSLAHQESSSNCPHFGFFSVLKADRNDT